METNLEKAKRLVYDHAYAGGIELPEDGFLFKMLELAATPDSPDSINNDLHRPAVSVTLPTVKDVRSKAIEYAKEVTTLEDMCSYQYAKKDFIEGAEWMRTKAVGN